MSFYCPTVSENKGKKLQDQQRWVRATQKVAGDTSRSEEVTLDDSVALTERELRRVEDAIAAQLQQDGLPVFKRLAAGAGVLKHLTTATSEKGKKGLLVALDQISDLTRDALIAAGTEGGKSAKGASILALFLGQDCPPRKLRRMSHFVGVRLFNLGIAPLHSFVAGGKASWRQIRAVAFDPPTTNENAP